MSRGFSTYLLDCLVFNIFSSVFLIKTVSIDWTTSIYKLFVMVNSYVCISRDIKKTPPTLSEAVDTSIHNKNYLKYMYLKMTLTWGQKSADTKSFPIYMYTRYFGYFLPSNNNNNGKIVIDKSSITKSRCPHFWTRFRTAIFHLEGYIIQWKNS